MSAASAASGPGVVVWVASLAHGWGSGGAEADVLPAHERHRARAMGANAASARFTRARVVLRSVLAEHLGCAPARVPLEIDARGKPRLGLGAPRVAVSVSHSHEFVAVALSEGAGVGVDVEALAGPRRRRVLPGVLAPDELRQVDAAPDAEGRVRAFLCCWTRKEAYLKGIGCGLRVDPTQVAIGRGRDGVLRPVAVAPELGAQTAWTLADLELEDYVGAVALAGPAVAATTRRWVPPAAIIPGPIATRPARPPPSTTASTGPVSRTPTTL